jgi:hypothetical protein
MARVAARVYLEASEITRLELLAQQLPQDKRVQVTLDDGSQVLGVVSAMPSMQAFFDPEGREGMNALVRIETQNSDHRADGNDRTVWLDQIIEITPLPNPSPPEPSRAWPPDPNAPTVD